MSRKLRRTKIVCTMGPATDRDNNLEKIIAAGANVVRMKFSHGTPDDHIERAERVRAIAKKLGKTVAILGDLQGPKIRVSTFKDGKIFLNVGDKFILDAELPKGEGNQEAVGLDYKTLPQDVVPGDILLLDDGRVQLKVLSTDGAKVFTEVTVGGPLSNNKGINKLGGGLSADALTEKDKADIITAARIGVDYLAVSFPRSSADLNYARELAKQAGLDAKIVAKVERAETVVDDKNRAFETYKKICPAYLEEISEIHRTEPYVYSQMIAGKDAARFGEAKNSWLTGTAAWTFTSISQYILGVRASFGGLTIDPCLPDSIKNLTITRKFRDAVYNITINNNKHERVSSLIVNGNEITGNTVPFNADTKEFNVIVNI